MPSHPAFSALHGYFRSGWAFLIPYLAAYLLYAWLQWPVNPGATPSGVPCLLHVYWTLHGIHLVMAVGTLRALWLEPGCKSNDGQLEPRHARAPDFGPVRALLPWLCLALLFWISGVHTEFPGDTWAHYIRIGDWVEAARVTEHASWNKWSYFFAFSLVGANSSLEYWSALNLFYVGACLLLSWQYYRLGQTLGANSRTALLFVLLQALFLGNNLFGFYRYYGISSTLFAQLGAVAVCRVAFELARTLPASAKPVAELAPATLCLLLLGGLIAANHFQGLAVAALGSFAAAVWALFRLRRSLVWAGLAALLLLNCAAVWWRPTGEVFETIYRSRAWFGGWYGFNLLAPESAAFQRATAILGWTGALSLIAALFLLRRNHPVAHLTLVPLLTLCLPFPAVPLLYTILHHHGNPYDIVTFHRLLWASPPLLALLVAGGGWISCLPRQPRWPALDRQASYAGLLAALTLAVIVPAGSPGFNRLYHVFASTPDDLSLRGTLRTLAVVAPLVTASVDRPTLAASEIYYATGFASAGTDPHGLRLVSYGRAVAPATDPLTFPRYRPHTVFLPALDRLLYTPVSFVGFLSGHWLPHRAAFALRGGPEFAAMAPTLHYEPLAEAPFPIYLLQTTESKRDGSHPR